MYEELVKRLRSHSGWALNKTLDEAANAIESTNKAYQMISEAYEAEVTKQNWIPVTERLPGKDVPVLVYLFGDSPYIAWINHDGEWETEEFTIDRDYLPKTWMPLPEPQKEGR